MVKLSFERVFLTNHQAEKVAKAIRNKKPFKLQLKKGNLNGEYPIYLSPNNKAKLEKARMTGSGCNCEVGLEEIDKLANSKAGKGLFMPGSGASKGKSKARPPTEIITKNPIENKATFQIPQEINEVKGQSLFMLNETRGTGMTMIGRGMDAKTIYGPSYINHNYPMTFI